MRVLVPNPVSSFLSYQIFEFPSERVAARGRERTAELERAPADSSLEQEPIDAIALKVASAGPRYRGTHVVDASLIAALEQFAITAPSQTATALGLIRSLQARFPRVPLVAAMETEFHRSVPDQACRYGLPWSGEAADAIRRYGSHGASHQYVSEAVPSLLRRSSSGLRLVSCHLGATSSLCAIVHGRSVDISSGFSIHSGIEGAVRHGDVEPAALFYAMDRNGWTAEELKARMSQQGGLAALSGIAGGDVKEIEQASYAGNVAAELALSTLCYQVKKYIGAFAAAMGGLDAIAFTGHFGEGSAALRMRCCQGLEFFGLQMDPERNEEGPADRVISAEHSAVQAAVIAGNEDLIVGRRAYAALQARASLKRRAQ